MLMREVPGWPDSWFVDDAHVQEMTMTTRKEGAVQISVVCQAQGLYGEYDVMYRTASWTNGEMNEYKSGSVKLETPLNGQSAVRDLLTVLMAVNKSIFAGPVNEA